MDPITGVSIAAAGVAVIVVYRFSQRHSTSGASVRRSGKSARTRGQTGRLPKRSWLVGAWNSTGARKTDSEDLHGATAELAGRAIGSAGRRTRRRWRAVKTAADRRYTRREQRWERSGRPPTLFSRRPRPTPEAAAPAQPAPAAGPPPAAPPAAATKPERHLKAVPDSNPGEPVTADTTTAPTTAAAPGIPPDWALLIDRVRNFVPEDDAALLTFIRGEAAGFVALGEALEQTREACVNDVGLDPAAVQGFTVVSEHVSDSSERMTEQLALFNAIYGEVQATAANGTLLPFNGRFFSGAAG